MTKFNVNHRALTSALNGIQKFICWEKTIEGKDYWADVMKKLEKYRENETPDEVMIRIK